MADSTTNSSIYGTSVSTSGVGGLMSGLDTKTLVEQMAQATQIKINRQFQAKQKLVYKQDAFRELIGKMVSFNDKYFSYSSKTNILSSNFFKSNTITSSNDNVKVSGDTSQIQNFKINSITSVAKNSSYISPEGISDGSFTGILSGKSSVSNNALAGESFTITLNKKSGDDVKVYSQTLKFADDFNETDLSKIADELNKQISASGTLKNDVEYTVDTENNKLILNKKDGSSATNIHISSVSDDVSNSLKINQGTDGSSATGIDATKLISNKSLKDMFTDGCDVTFNLNGVSKVIKFTSDDWNDNLLLNRETESEKLNVDKVKELFQDKINKAFGYNRVNTGTDESPVYEDKPKVLVGAAQDIGGTGADVLTFSTSNDANILSISSIDSNLSEILGIESGSANRISKDKAISDLFDGLGGTARESYKVKINGQKVELDNTDGSLTINKIIEEIEKKANVNINYISSTGRFKITDKTNPSKECTIVDEDDGKLASGLFNSVNTDLKFDQAIGELHLNGVVTNEYSIKVNDVDFTFNNTDTVNSIMKKINTNSEAGISISYSSVSDKFSITTKESGSHTAIDIRDAFADSHLVEKLFKPGEYTEDDGTKVNNHIHIANGSDTVMNVDINGEKIDINRSTSTFSLDGITVELNEKAVGITEPVTFTASANIDEVTEKVAEFVDEYNKIIDALDTKLTETPNKDYAPLTAKQREEMTESEEKAWDEKAKAGMLYCNSTVSQALYDIRNAASTFVDGMSLKDIGISSAFGDYTGKLVFDEDTFRQKFAENPEKVTELFTKDDATGKGVAVAIKNVVYDNVGLKGEKGLFAEQAGTKNTSSEKTNFLSERIKEYEDLIKKLETKMKAEKEKYWKQFSALETALANFSSQSAFVSSMFQ